MLLAALLGLAAAGEIPFAERAEYHFLRLEYTDLPQRRGFRRGWWMQDWPEADAHYSQGIRRLTRIDTGAPQHLPLTDDRIFSYPAIYATQVGYWDLRDPEIQRLRAYLDRGGFLVTDDFYGETDWRVFSDTMRRVYPDRSIEEIDLADPVMHILYDVNERVQIPGLRHLGRTMPGLPEWHVIRDERGRIVVAVNFNMDVGDAWEHADMPEYPAEMTGLAYRFGLNYLLYSLTH